MKVSLLASLVSVASGRRVEQNIQSGSGVVMDEVEENVQSDVTSGGRGFTLVGNGWCLDKHGDRIPWPVNWHSSVSGRREGSSKTCHDMCLEDSSCRGYITEDGSKCQVVTSSSNSRAGNPAGEITGADSESRNYCWAKSSTPTPAPAPRPSPSPRPSPRPSPSPSPNEAFTPSQADWSQLQTMPMDNSRITGHDPDSIGTIQQWSTWDGHTIYRPDRLSKDDFYSAICPHDNALRGIYDVFQQHKPFRNNANPTKAEVDAWNIIVINHLRALVGYTSSDRQAKPDHCMAARALWANERKHTTKWDSAYPGTFDSAAGPCVHGHNAHCGASFLPNAHDQQPYLPNNYPTCASGGGAEGVFGLWTGMPWSIQLSNVICSSVQDEGFFGGHPGPFFHREKFGIDFWDCHLPREEHAYHNGITIRAKWTGNLMPSMYTER